MRIRRAGIEDVPWVCAQLRDFADSAPLLRKLYGSQEHAEVVVGNLVRDHYMAIAERDGAPVGFIAGMLAPHPFNPDLLFAAEVFWWVTLPHRGSRAGAMLFNDFDRWADNSGAHLVGMTREASSPISERAYLRRGYQPAEQQYVRCVGGIA